MIIRFWKFSITFHKYDLGEGWMFGITYIDGGLHFTIFRYEMDFDWGFIESDWSFRKQND
jgi:hypothetical protein